MDANDNINIFRKHWFFHRDRLEYTDIDFEADLKFHYVMMFYIFILATILNQKKYIFFDYESCLRGVLFDFRYKNNKDYYKLPTDKHMLRQHLKTTCALAVDVFDKIYKMF